MGFSVPGVFKPYDIRGVYPDELDEVFAYMLGRAVPRVFGCSRVAVGHDARLSSPALYAYLVSGLREEGAEVDAMGMCATELVYYAVGRSDEYDAGVVVTASHNPAEFNGFKIIDADARPVDGQGGLRSIAEEMDAVEEKVLPAADTPSRRRGIEEEYIEFAAALTGWPEGGGLTVVVDASNGVARLLWDILAGRIDVKLVRMNFEPDGNFPAHPPDPSHLPNLLPLQDKVRECKADLGLVYDGDADRVVAVLAGGRVAEGPEMAAAAARRVLDKHPECDIAVSMVATRMVLSYFRALGREPLLVPVGHAKVKKAMRSAPNLLFAAEMSGHYYYREFFCCDSALITTLNLVHLVGDGEMESIVAALAAHRWAPPLEGLFAVRARDEAAELCLKTAGAILQMFPNPDEIICEKDWQVLRGCCAEDLNGAEGVRVDYPDWWFCVRPSGTEDIVRLTVEASRPEVADERLQQISGVVTGFRQAPKS